jgi:hypothetical protein
MPITVMSCAVVVAAVRHAVEMRADHDARRGAVAARQGDVEIAGEIGRDLERQPAPQRRHALVRIALAGTERGARHPGRILGMLAQLAEQPVGQCDLGLEPACQAIHHAIRIASPSLRLAMMAWRRPARSL